jgi:hypothetical protein
MLVFIFLLDLEHYEERRHTRRVKLPNFSLPFFFCQDREPFVYMKTSCMKIILAVLFVLFVTHRANAQSNLSNTKWKGVFLIPQAADVLLDFKKDSLYLILAEDNQRLGALTFSQQNDTLMITKISGNSPCPEGSTGWYRIEWIEKGEKFFLRGINDECEGRAGVYTTHQFERVRN